MDWMTFVTKMTEALIWPVMVFAIVILFRKQVLALLPSLNKLTLPGGIEANFEKKLDTVERITTSTVFAGENDSDDDELLGSAVILPTKPKTDEIALKNNPTGAVMENWKELELAILIGLVQIGVTTFLTAPATLIELIHFSRVKGLIDARDAEAIDVLRELRDDVAHGYKAIISSDSAERFAVQAQHIVSNIQRRVHELQSKGRP